MVINPYVINTVINDIGKTITVRYKSVSEYNNETGIVGTSFTEVSVKGYVYTQAETSTGGVVNYDRSVVLKAVNTSGTAISIPKTYDRINDGSKEYEIVESQPVTVQDSTLFYMLRVKV